MNQHTRLRCEYTEDVDYDMIQRSVSSDTVCNFEDMCYDELIDIDYDELDKTSKLVKDILNV